jgi:hypothetical protein
VAALLLAAQYDFFGQASSTMTELPFAAGLALASWGWAERRPWLAAAGLGWCGVARPEGVLFALAGAAALWLRHRRVGPAALALAPLAAWALAGALALGDVLWFLHWNAYAGMVAPRLDLRQLADSWFYEALRRGQPPALVMLEIGGAVLALGPARRLRFLLAPVAVSFVVLTFARIGATDAWRESRYLVAVAPALALLAAAGLDAALAGFPRAAPPVLLGVAAASAASELLWTWRPLALAIPYAWPGTYALALAAAALLWSARRTFSPRVALGLLLIMPLACSPPGAYGKQRPESAPAHGTSAAASAGVPSATCDFTPQSPCSSPPG